MLNQSFMDHNRLLNEILDEWSRIPPPQPQKIEWPMWPLTYRPGNGIWHIVPSWVISMLHEISKVPQSGHGNVGRKDRQMEWSQYTPTTSLYDCFVLCILLFLLFAYHWFICSVEVLYCFQIWHNCGQILHPWMECMFMIELGNMCVLLPNNNNINSCFPTCFILPQWTTGIWLFGKYIWKGIYHIKTTSNIKSGSQETTIFVGIS